MKSIKRKVISMILCFGILLTVIPCYTGKSLASDRVIKIGYCVYENFITERNGKYYGYAVDILDKVSEYTGWKYEYIYDTWSNCMAMLKTGEIDFIIQAHYTEERAEDYLYSEREVGYEDGELCTRMSNDQLYYEDIEAFDGMVVGELKGGFQNKVFVDYAEQKGFQYQIKEYDTLNELFDALDDQEVDAITVGGLASRKGYKLLADYAVDPIYAITSKDHEALMKEFDRAMTNINTSDPYFVMGLYRQYYETRMLGSQPSFTREEMEYIRSCGVIRVGQFDYGLPYYSDTKDGKLGVQVDMLDRISELSGLEFESITITQEEQEAVDFYSGIFMPVGVKTTGEYLSSDDVYPLQYSLIQAQGKFVPFDENLRIGILKQREFLDYDYIKEFPEATFVEYDTIDKCLGALVFGAVDYAYLDESTASVFIKRNYSGKLSLLNSYGAGGHMRYIYPKTVDPLLVAIMNKCIVRIDTEELISLSLSYSMEAMSQVSLKEIVSRYRIQIIVFLLLIIFVFYLLIILNMSRKEQERQLLKYNADLKESNKNLEKASLAKTEFLSNMSHEIRTPMNAIMGITNLAEEELQKRDGASCEQMESYLRDIKLSSKYLLDIINSILDMNRIERGKLVLTPEWLVSKQLADNCVNMIRQQMIEKDINFIYKSELSEEDNVESLLDRTRSQQIIMNLLNNAYKFTGPGGTVTLQIRIRRRENGWGEDEITVSDTGCGMSNQFLERIFEPFEQERNQYSDTYPGSGLGLALVKQIIDQMGGNVVVDSALGVGTTFRVYLPYEYRIASDTDKKKQEQKEQEEISAILSGKKILLVEDEKLNRKVAEKILQHKNITIDYAENGAVAVEMFANAPAGRYDAILMDVRMPVMDGMEATRQIRALFKEDALTVPIIAMTANAFAEDISNCLRAGMNAHLAKPIQPELLFQTLAKYLS